MGGKKYIQSIWLYRWRNDWKYTKVAITKYSVILVTWCHVTVITAWTLDPASLRSLWSQHPEEDQWQRGDDTWLSAHSEGGSISGGIRVASDMRQTVSPQTQETQACWLCRVCVLTPRCLMSHDTWYIVLCQTRHSGQPELLNFIIPDILSWWSVTSVETL